MQAVGSEIGSSVVAEQDVERRNRDTSGPAYSMFALWLVAPNEGLRPIPPGICGTPLIEVKFAQNAFTNGPKLSVSVLYRHRCTKYRRVHKQIYARPQILSPEQTRHSPLNYCVD